MPDIVLQHVNVFALVFVRMSSFFFLTPFFGSRNIPIRFKMGIAFMLALLMTPAVAASEGAAAYVNADLADLFIIIIKEMMIGITLGLVSAMLFAAVQVGGMFIDMQIGYAMANIFDPINGTTSPLTGQFKFVLTMLLFMGFDGHHGLLTALLQSYQFFPLGGFVLSENLFGVIVQTMSLMFLLGLKVAIPIVAALFLTDVGLAILSRAVPQMNVFVVGMSVKLVVGGVMLVVALPALVFLLRELFKTMFSQLDTLLRVMGG
jgi:flagellar biosynthetic protein FliR